MMLMRSGRMVFMVLAEGGRCAAMWCRRQAPPPDPAFHPIAPCGSTARSFPVPLAFVAPSPVLLSTFSFVRFAFLAPPRDSFDIVVLPSWRCGRPGLASPRPRRQLLHFHPRAKRRGREGGEGRKGGVEREGKGER